MFGYFKMRIADFCTLFSNASPLNHSNINTALTTQHAVLNKTSRLSIPAATVIDSPLPQLATPTQTQSDIKQEKQNDSDTDSTESLSVVQQRYQDRYKEFDDAYISNNDSKPELSKVDGKFAHENINISDNSDDDFEPEPLNNFRTNPAYEAGASVYELTIDPAERKRIFTAQQQKMQQYKLK